MLSFQQAMAHERGRRVRWARKKPELRKLARRVVDVGCLPTQYRFVTDQKTHTLVAIGGVGAGKTRALMDYVGIKMSREAGSGTLGGIFANTYQQLNQSTLPKLWELFNKVGFEHGRDYVYNQAPPRFWRGFQSQFLKHNNILSVRYWGQAVTRSLDNYDDIRGIEIGWAACDELRNTEQEAFNVILARLRDPRCSSIEFRAATSPNGFDWLYNEFIEAPARDPLLSRSVVHMRTIDNVFLGEQYYRTLLAAYDPKTAQQELEGLFVSLTNGQVYHQFKREVHVKDWVVPHPGLSWQLCFDFNRTPYSVVLCQTHRDPKTGVDTVWCVDEVSMEDADTGTVCREIMNKRLVGFDSSPALIEIFGDPQGRERDTRNNRSDYDIIMQEMGPRYGNRLCKCWRTSHPAVMDRVNTVNSMLNNGVGECRLYIAPKCALLRRDFERVMYKRGSSEIDKSGDKNKMLTHLSDGLGYFIQERYPIRTNRVELISR